MKSFFNKKHDWFFWLFLVNLLAMFALIGGHYYWMEKKRKKADGKIIRVSEGYRDAKPIVYISLAKKHGTLTGRIFEVYERNENSSVEKIKGRIWVDQVTEKFSVCKIIEGIVKFEKGDLIRDYDWDPIETE